MSYCLNKIAIFFLVYFHLQTSLKNQAANPQHHIIGDKKCNEGIGESWASGAVQWPRAAVLQGLSATRGDQTTCAQEVSQSASGQRYCCSLLGQRKSSMHKVQHMGAQIHMLG